MAVWSYYNSNIKFISKFNKIFINVCFIVWHYFNVVVVIKALFEPRDILLSKRKLFFF